MKTTDIFYENQTTLLPTRSETTTSKGDVLKTVFKYPHDFVSQEPYTSMVNTRHIWSPVIEQDIYKNDSNFLNLTKTNYNFWNNSWGVNNSSSLILPQTLETKVLNAANDTRVQFNAYDPNGNVQEQQKTNNVKEVYLWGYKGLYPVVKVVGADYASVLLAMTQNSITQTQLDNAATIGDAGLRSLLAPLRTALPNTLITIYTYFPLAGITSQTDMAGRITYYEYDAFHRLRDIKDKDGNVIKTFDYHYKE